MTTGLSARRQHRRPPDFSPCLQPAAAIEHRVPEEFVILRNESTAGIWWFAGGLDQLQACRHLQLAYDD